MKPGVYIAKKKDNTTYYRASITYKSKHISLGSFDTEDKAHEAYLEAGNVISNNDISIHSYKKENLLAFDKWISLINLRDNGMYFRTPIYLHDKFFYYYLSLEDILIFDVDDLFYYSTRKIMKRGGHLFVADYGMQVNILSRYGIKNYAVAGRDYIFKNGIENDYRYSNIEIINHYHGVLQEMKKGIVQYVAKIHVNGDIIIGRYRTENDAAIAYNKAVDILKSKGVDKNFPTNYISEIDVIKYSSIYNKLRISSAILNYQPPCS